MHENPNDARIKTLLEHAKRIAVVGLSEKPYRTSFTIARALKGFGYGIVPINPNLTGPVLEEHPYARLQDIPGDIDIVDVFRRSEEVMPIAQDAVAIGAKILWMQSGVVNERAAEYARGYGLTVVMDRCIKVEYAMLAGR